MQYPTQQRPQQPMQQQGPPQAKPQMPLQQAAQPTPQPGQPGQPGQSQGGGVDQVLKQFDPAERTAFHGMVANAWKTLSEQTDAVMAQVSQGKDPIAAAGQVAGLLVFGLVQDAMSDNRQVQKRPAILAVQQIASDVLELGHAQGAIQLPPGGAQQAIAQAAEAGMAQYVQLGQNQRKAMSGGQGQPGQRPTPPQGGAPQASGPQQGGGLLGSAPQGNLPV